jgi:hypothetical protein
MCRCRKGYFHHMRKTFPSLQELAPVLMGRELAMHHLAVGVRAPLGTSGSQRLGCFSVVSVCRVNCYKRGTSRLGRIPFLLLDRMARQFGEAHQG